MTAEDWVEQSLLASHDVTTFVDSRIYALFIEVADRPYILFRRNQTDSLKDLATGQVVFEDAEVRLDLYCDTYPQMVDLANACIAALDGPPGMFVNRSDAHGQSEQLLRDFTAIPANQDLIYHTILYFRVKFFV